jgi:hypothetical protein
MTPYLFRTLVAEAALAPSVHNVQPARWRQEGDAALLFEDPSMRLPAGDPQGWDAGMSLGAACEGMALAASAAGLATRVEPVEGTYGQLRLCARITFAPGAAPDPLAAHVAARRSWRGAFAPATAADRAAAAALAARDAAVIADASVIAEVAHLSDAASHGFLRQPEFRAELLSWMRLSPAHPRWGVDGLNAAAMALGPLERLAAGAVLGTAFRLLDTLGLAAPLLADRVKTQGAAAILILHRPEVETAFDCGRAFYRAWLGIEAAGFGAAVMAALSDDARAAARLWTMTGLPDRCRIVTAFRIGRRPAHTPVPRARRAVEELLVQSMTRNSGNGLSAKVMGEEDA